MHQDERTAPQAAIARIATPQRTRRTGLSRRQRRMRRGIVIPLAVVALAYLALVAWECTQLAQSGALAPTQDAAQQALTVPGVPIPFAGEVGLAVFMLALLLACAVLLPGALRPARAALAPTGAPSNAPPTPPPAFADTLPETPPATPPLSARAGLPVISLDTPLPDAPRAPAPPAVAELTPTPAVADVQPSAPVATATASSAIESAAEGDLGSPNGHDAPAAPEQPAPALKGKKLRLFISHSSADKQFGLDLERRLKLALGEDADVFYDRDGGPSGLIGGDEWQRRIERKLVECNVFVVILSPDALGSNWVETEIRLALSDAIGSRAVFVPLLHKAVDPIPPFIAIYQYVSFLPAVPDQQAFDDLLDAVKASESRLKELQAPLAARIGPPYDLGQLPALDHFIGREAEIAEVVKLLLRGPSAMSGLASIAAANGLGGIGKSTLAAAVLRKLFVDGFFPDGLAVVKCNGQKDAATVLRMALARFGVQGEELEKANLAQLVSIIEATFKPKGAKPKDALIVLDNVEPELPIKEVVQPLRAAGVALLLTSRAIMPAEAVPEEANVKLNLLTREQALELFAQSYGRFAFVDLTPPEQAAAERIVTLLDRHTLAVKLAGVYARKRPAGTLDAVAVELAANPRRLKNGSEKVSAVVDASIGSLSLAAQRLFVALGTFDSTDVGRKAVLAVAEHLGDEDGTTSLDALIELRLVDTDALPDMPRESDFERIRLHPLVATDTEQRFKQLEESERRAAEVAVSRWYAGYANATPDEVLGPDEENIGRAIELAHRNDEDVLLVALCDGMRSYWRDRSRNALRQRYLPWGLEAAQRIAEASNEREVWIALARLQLSYGELLFTLGRVREAEEFYHKSIALSREWGNRSAESATLTSLGRLMVQRGDLDAALRLYQEAIEIDREIGSRRNEGVDLADLGDIQQRHGDLAGAQANYERYLAIAREEGDTRGEGIALGLLGSIFVRRGDLTSAQASYEQSLAIMRQLGAAREVGAALTALGHIALQRGDLAAAENFFEQAIEIDREIGSRRDEAVDLADLGDILAERGDLAAAQANYERALAIMQEVGDRRNEGTALSKLGDILAQRGDLTEAQATYERVLAIMRQVGDPREEGVALAKIGDILVERGDLADAQDHYERALATMQAVGDVRGEGVTLGKLSGIARSRGNLHEAEQYRRQSLAIYHEVQDRRGEGIALFFLAQIVQSQGRLDEAEQCYRDALALLETAQDSLNYANVATAAAQFFIEQRGNREEGMALLQRAIEARGELGEEN